MNTNATPATSRLQSDLTRRKFLRNSTITASALSYSRIAARAAGKEDSAAINIALVGCGGRGTGGGGSGSQFGHGGPL